jgi:hypothetical protein
LEEKAMNKSIYGTYRGEFIVPDGEMYIGVKDDGQEFAQMSLLNTGSMHSDFDEIVSLTDKKAELIFINYEQPIHISLVLDDKQLKVHTAIKDFYSVDSLMEKVSDNAVYMDHYVVIPEKNIEILKANNDYADDDVTVNISYDFRNETVVKELKKRGFEMAKDSSFASVWELYTKTCELYTQDGMGYVHSKDSGTMAQILQAEKNGNFTNCRGISNIFAGVLRANGIKAFFEVLMSTDPDDHDGHVVTEAYISDLGKYVLFDPSTCSVFKLDGTYLNSIELKNAFINGRSQDIEIEYCNEKKHRKDDEIGTLAYLSKNLCHLWRCIECSEIKDGSNDNRLVLSPAHAKDVYADWGFVTSQLSTYFDE